MFQTRSLIPQETKIEFSKRRKNTIIARVISRGLRAQRRFTFDILVPELSAGYSAMVLNGVEAVLSKESFFIRRTVVGSLSSTVFYNRTIKEFGYLKMLFDEFCLTVFGCFGLNFDSSFGCLVFISVLILLILMSENSASPAVGAAVLGFGFSVEYRAFYKIDLNLEL